MKQRIDSLERAIPNPASPRRFQQLKPVDGEVCIWFVETLVAKTLNALRVLEITAQVYVSVLYVPRGDIRDGIHRAENWTTICLFERRCRLLRHPDERGSLIGEAMTLSYERTFGFAQQLEDRIAIFWGRVSVQERLFSYQPDTI